MKLLEDFAGCQCLERIQLGLDIGGWLSGYFDHGCADVFDHALQFLDPLTFRVDLCLALGFAVRIPLITQCLQTSFFRFRDRDQALFFSNDCLGKCCGILACCLAGLLDRHTGTLKRHKCGMALRTRVEILDFRDRLGFFDQQDQFFFVLGSAKGDSGALR